MSSFNYNMNLNNEVPPLLNNNNNNEYDSQDRSYSENILDMDNHRIINYNTSTIYNNNNNSNNEQSIPVINVVEPHYATLNDTIRFNDFYSIIQGHNLNTGYIENCYDDILEKLNEGIYNINRNIEHNINDLISNNWEIVKTRMLLKVLYFISEKRGHHTYMYQINDALNSLEMRYNIAYQLLSNNDNNISNINNTTISINSSTRNEISTPSPPPPPPVGSLVLQRENATF
jgi:hypothetical protein